MNFYLKFRYRYLLIIQIILLINLQHLANIKLNSLPYIQFIQNINARLDVGGHQQMTPRRSIVVSHI